MFAGMALSVRLFVCAGLSWFIICEPYLSVVVCVFYAYNLTLYHHITTSPCHHVTTSPHHHVSQSFALPPATKPVSHLTCPLPLRHRITTSLHHCTTASLCHCITASPHHCITTSLHHRITASQC